jgi:ABC-type Na+ efflux pump permease subunit
MSRAGLVRVQQLTAAEAQKADELVRRGRFDAVVLVPAGYAQSLLAGSADSSFIPHPSSLPGAAGLDVVCDQASPDGQAALQAVQTALGRMRLSAVIGRLAAGDRDEGGRTTGRSQKSDGRSQMSEVRSGRGRTTEGGPDSSFIPHPSSLSVAAFAAQAGKTWSSPALTIASEPATGEPAKVRVVANGFNQASPGTLVQFTIFGVMTAAMLLVFERRSRTLARLLSTPATKVEVIGGHVLAMFIVTFLQGLLLVVLGQLAFGVHYLNNIAGVLCVLAALSLWVASLGLLIGTLAKGPEQVSVFSMIAMFFFAAGGGAWFPLEITGRAFSTMGHLLPSAWAMDGLQNVAVRGLGFGSVVVPVLVLAGYAALFFALAVARFRVEN